MLLFDSNAFIFRNFTRQNYSYELQGLAEWDQMIATVFQYLNMLKTLSKTEQKRIFEEIQKIEKLNWETKEDKKSLSNCVEASENMRRFPSSEWLTGDDLLKDYSDDVITSALNQLGMRI